jgi:hypothetical protein
MRPIEDARSLLRQRGNIMDTATNKVQPVHSSMMIGTICKVISRAPATVIFEQYESRNGQQYKVEKALTSVPNNWLVEGTEFRAMVIPAGTVAHPKPGYQPLKAYRFIKLP